MYSIKNNIVKRAFSKFRDSIGRILQERSMRVHHSPMNRKVAPIYTAYLTRCRTSATDYDRPVPECDELRGAVDSFRRDRAATIQSTESELAARSIIEKLENPSFDQSLWAKSKTGEASRYAGNLWVDFPELESIFLGLLGKFLKAHFQSPFKIFYGILYRSTAVGLRKGSQIWHLDGGPGICVNVMYFLKPTNLESGSLEILNWADSLELYMSSERRLADDLGSTRLKYSKEQIRIKRNQFYEQVIRTDYKKRVICPSSERPGLLVPFSNNNLHRGGYPLDGSERVAMVFHCYPSHKVVDLSRYRLSGIAKTGAYPLDPALDF